MNYLRFEVDPHTSVAYVGPHLSEGPLPALFYFSLSDQDSLCLDPFNQPVAYLSALPMRIFSMTLPGHENNLPPTQALHFWAEQIASGNNIIDAFVEKVRRAIHALIHQEALISDRVAVAGLSRGAFLAAHAAAAIDTFQWVLGFAPLTKLSYAKEFQALHNHPIVLSLDLEHLADRLSHRKVRFYIGNCDARVSTRHCFDCLEKFTQKALENKVRSPQMELIIGPSIGRDGHGTSLKVFHTGAQWIAEELGAIHVV
jgi:predicted esterase